MVGPAGETPQELVGIKDSHFSVLPISDFLGQLRFVTVIFAAEELKGGWTVGVDVFADVVDELDGVDPLCNHGPGKRYPGLSLFGPDGNEIPVLFAATPKASMTSSILKDTFQMMDDLGISQRGVNEDGTEYLPFVIIDGHPSRMGEDFLRYVNDEAHLWKILLGAPYGTGKWQFHDDKRQNGMFKMQLVEAKRQWYKKRSCTVSHLRSCPRRLSSSCTRPSSPRSWSRGLEPPPFVNAAGTRSTVLLWMTPKSLCLRPRT